MPDRFCGFKNKQRIICYSMWHGGWWGWPPLPVQCSWWSSWWTILMTPWTHTHQTHRWGCAALDGCQPWINLNSHVVPLLLLWSLDFFKHKHHTVPKAVECTSKRRWCRYTQGVKSMSKTVTRMFLHGGDYNRKKRRRAVVDPLYHCNCTRPEFNSVLRHICMQRKAQVYVSRCGHPLTISYHINHHSWYPVMDKL